MVKKIFAKQITEKLLAMQAEILNKPVPDDQIDFDGDETDEIQANMILELHNQLNSRDAQKIESINNALKRLSAGEFGQCQDCELDIAEKRLMANPCCLTCIDCAEDRELALKRR